MKINQAMQQVRNMPFYPIVPFLPLWLMATSFVILARLHWRLHKIEAKLDSRRAGDMH